MPALNTWEWGEGQWRLHNFHPEIPQILSFWLQHQAPPEPLALPVPEGRAGTAGGGGQEGLHSRGGQGQALRPRGGD